MSDDTELLHRYAQDGSEAAFAELVRQRINFVYAVALRQVGNDTHLAKDVTQAVFVDLARKAHALSSHPTLPSWLYTSTRFAAAKARRQQARRLKREQEAHAMNEIHSDAANDAAWTQIRPVLDDAMHELPESDRAAIILRYFEGLTLADVGARLGLAENSARMRVERAVDKLRLRLARRGIVSTAAALGSTLAAQPGVPAPAGLTAAVTGAAIAGGIGPVSTCLLMTTQTKILAATAVLALLAGFGGYQWKTRELAAAAPIMTAPPAVVVRTPAPVPPPVAALATAPEAAPPAKAEPNRPETASTLRARGAAVQVRLWDASGKFEFSADARKFFKLSDEEAEKLLQALKLRMKEIADVAMNTMQIFSNDGNTIVLTVPPGPGEKVVEQFEQDVAGIIGLERSAEFLDLGARDLALRLRQHGTEGRSLTVSRSAPIVSPDGTLEPLFRYTEDLGVTSITGFSRLKNPDGSANLFSRFSPELSGLTIAGPPTDGAKLMGSDGVAR